MTSQMAAATQKIKYMMNPVIIIYALQATMIHNMHQRSTILSVVDAYQKAYGTGKNVMVMVMVQDTYVL
jgi:hypothetical protein